MYFGILSGETEEGYIVKKSKKTYGIDDLCTTSLDDKSLIKIYHLDEFNEE